MPADGRESREVRRISGGSIARHPGNPLDSIDALRRVTFVMKDGIVLKRDGVVTPEKFFNPGPVHGSPIR